MKTLILMFAVFAVFAAAALIFSQKARSFARDVGYGISQMLFGHMARNGLILGAYNFPEGTKFYFADYSTNLATSIAASAISNANPAVATTATQAWATGDELLLEGSWDDATDSIYRAGSVTTTTAGLLGLNSTSTTLYPSTSSAGTLKKITTWTEIPQVLGIQTSGGDAKFGTVSPLGRRTDINFPIGFNPMTYTLTLGHDPSLAAYITMVNLSRTNAKVCFKGVAPNASATSGYEYGFGYLLIQEAAQKQRGQANQVTATFAFLNKFLTY